ncbi:putative inner membrane protein [Candidatus Blochmanniella floridana]|uniref:Putative inner membrane protein n=1 Tax=Blochmanniella floridana TaxID=203907 RepID=Q7VQR3_BLOFL|nr:putative inner membrane protein [Candidatus Blochmannia floridanus]
MNSLKELLSAVNQGNLTFIFNIKLILMIYVLVFVVLFVENAMLLAFFLPGDSLLIIVGILIAKGILNFFITLLALTIAVSLGSWVSYLQGRFLKNSSIFKRWLSYLPIRSYQRASNMLDKHGLCTLFVGRFVTFLRTVLPTMAGVSGLNFLKFQLFNWISSFTWVLILIIVGFCLGQSKYLLNFIYII